MCILLEGVCWNDLTVELIKYFNYGYIVGIIWRVLQWFVLSRPKIALMAAERFDPIPGSIFIWTAVSRVLRFARICIEANYVIIVSCRIDNLYIQYRSYAINTLWRMIVHIKQVITNNKYCLTKHKTIYWYKYCWAYVSDRS